MHDTIHNPPTIHNSSHNTQFITIRTIHHTIHNSSHNTKYCIDYTINNTQFITQYAQFITQYTIHRTIHTTLFITEYTINQSTQEPVKNERYSTRTWTTFNPPSLQYCTHTWTTIIPLPPGNSTHTWTTYNPPPPPAPRPPHTHTHTPPSNMLHRHGLTRANRRLLVENGIVDVTVSCQGSRRVLVAIDAHVLHQGAVGRLLPRPECVGHGGGFRAASSPSPHLQVSQFGWREGQHRQ